MLDMSKLDLKEIWKLVKEARKSFLSTKTKLDCNYDKTLLSVREDFNKKKQ